MPRGFGTGLIHGALLSAALLAALSLTLPPPAREPMLMVPVRLAAPGAAEEAAPDATVAPPQGYLENGEIQGRGREPGIAPVAVTGPAGSGTPAEDLALPGGSAFAPDTDAAPRLPAPLAAAPAGRPAPSRQAAAPLPEPSPAAAGPTALPEARQGLPAIMSEPPDPDGSDLPPLAAPEPADRNPAARVLPAGPLSQQAEAPPAIPHAAPLRAAAPLSARSDLTRAAGMGPDLSTPPDFGALRLGPDE